MFKNLAFWNSPRDLGPSGSVPHDPLEQGIAELRTRLELPEERLSETCRGKILEAALHPSGENRPIASLFLPTRKVLFAGGLPLALSCALVLVFLHLRTPSISQALNVQATKQGDHVVFTIANGNRGHVVYKSNIPAHFERGSGIRIEDGTFSDLAAGGPDVVFYRID